MSPTACIEALKHADIAITTTPSREPLIHARDLHPGLHITAMGSDAEHKNELAPDVFDAGALRLRPLAARRACSANCITRSRRA